MLYIGQEVMERKSQVTFVSETAQSTHWIPAYDKLYLHCRSSASKLWVGCNYLLLAAEG